MHFNEKERLPSVAFSRSLYCSSVNGALAFPLLITPFWKTDVHGSSDEARPSSGSRIESWLCPWDEGVSERTVPVEKGVVDLVEGSARVALESKDGGITGRGVALGLRVESPLPKERFSGYCFCLAVPPSSCLTPL
jgi:hypothetical protein